MKMELVACEEVLMREIADSKMKRRDIAQTYRLALESSEAKTINWARVNGEILKRWSKSGLLWIKTAAWSGKCFEEKR